MKEDYQISEKLNLIKTNYIVHDHVIDSLYLKYGLAALKELDWELLVNQGDWNGREIVETYLNKKIEKAEHEAILRLQQLSYDVKHRKLMLKVFWPTIVLTFVSVAVAAFSAYNGYTKTIETKTSMIELENEVKSLKQKLSLLMQKKSSQNLLIKKATTEVTTSKKN